MSHRKVATRFARHLPGVFALLAVSACVAEPTRVVHEEAPPPDSNVYFYPAQGVTPSAEQQDRDNYECNAWSVQQTGFDPSLPNVPPHQRVHVVAGGAPAGAGIAAGAVTGAVVGAAISSPRHAGGGGVIGAITGAAIGGIADAERTAQADRIETNASKSQTAALEQKALAYRRAMTACLEGRGYSVR